MKRRFLNSHLFLSVPDPRYQHYAPKTGEANQCVDDSGYDSRLSAKYCGDKVKLEKPYKPPVDCANYHQYHCNDIQVNQLLSVLLSAKCKGVIRFQPLFMPPIISISKESNVTLSTKSSGKNTVLENASISEKCFAQIIGLDKSKDEHTKSTAASKFIASSVVSEIMMSSFFINPHTLKACYPQSFIIALAII